jgi:cobalt-zinc-cadmium efflux system membrane fusion protein
MAHVGSPLPGRVADVKVRAGDSVQNGAVLLILESTELGEAQSDYLQKRTMAAVTASAIEIAKSAFERGKALFEKNEGISLGELQKREGELKAAQGTAQAARAALIAAENKLRLLGMDDKAVAEVVESGRTNPRFALFAPISGRVVERKVTIGELAAPDKDSLIVLADMTTLWVIADVPESMIGDAAIGAKAVIRGAASAGDFEGTVSFISASLDPTTRSAQVRIELKNPPPALKPGMFAQAEIWASPPSDAKAVLAVPEKAVILLDGGPAVFVPVEGEPNTFAKRAIRAGPEIAGMIPVLRGLKEGEQVVVNGTFILKAELGKSSDEGE